MEYTTTLTEGEGAALVLGGTTGAIVGFYVATLFFLLILTIIASWRILKKAGEPGWKCLIPIYDVYMMYKIVNMRSWFWFMFCSWIVCFIVAAVNHSTDIFLMSGDQLIYYDWSANIPTLVALVLTLIITIVGTVIYDWRTSKAFGHGVGYFIGLLFLQPIFWLIIGFGKSKYNKKAIHA